MAHATSESDMTSLDLSSPHSPKRTVYFVQSPSRDSQDDGDKSSTAALTGTTPTESPSHQSSASRVSGGGGGFRWKGRRGRWHQERHVIEEEGGEYEDFYGENRGISTAKCRVILIAFATASAFLLLCLSLWGAARPFSPTVFVMSLNVHSFYYGEGSDTTGVPTKILSFNSSLKMTIHNPATFFGIHVTSSAFKLIYSDHFVLAIGQMKSYYQPRKSKHVVMVELVGAKIPLYGAGAYLAASDKNGGVPVTLYFEIRSRGNVLGSLVKSRHQKYLSCFFFISSDNTKLIRFNEKTCS